MVRATVAAVSTVPITSTVGDDAFLASAMTSDGEQALRIAAPDNTDEPRNRRVDHIPSDAAGLRQFGGR